MRNRRKLACRGLLISGSEVRALHGSLWMALRATEMVALSFVYRFIYRYSQTSVNHVIRLLQTTVRRTYHAGRGTAKLSKPIG